MTDDIKVALVSNRGPVSFSHAGDGFSIKRGAGGLAGAVDPVARRLGDRAVWIAAATSEDDRDAAKAGELRSLPGLLGYEVHLVEIEHRTYVRYYDLVSNRMLWFANHCLWDELGIHDFGQDELDAWRDSYEPVNRLFARTAAEHSDPDSLVLFQDYHLALAPRYLRELRPDQTTLHFTHSSFCGPGLARLPSPLPHRVIDGMLGADLIGFHTAAWAEGFLGRCEELGASVDRSAGSVVHEGRRSWVRTYPIPIDTGDLREQAGKEASRAWASRLRTGWTHGDPGAGSLVVRADRTEPSKNIVRGFEAFGLLLDRRPDLAASARFAACLYPSRQSMPEYQRYTAEIKEAVETVNARHPGSIRLYLEDDFDRTLGALRTYDVLLVNPIMDGMNLVSKEGPALNRRDGVLVLSRGAGSFEELGEHSVELADALDVEATATAIERALDMGPAERARRAASLKAIVEARRPADWIDAQLGDLVAIQRGGKPLTPSAT